MNRTSTKCSYGNLRNLYMLRHISLSTCSLSQKVVSSSPHIFTNFRTGNHVC